MSTATIATEISWRISEGRLFLVRPRRRHAAFRRTLLVSEVLWAALNSPEGDEVWEERIGRLAADLETFISARVISHKYLYLLSPTSKGVWEIRSTQPNPSIRVLGCFAEKDVFVAMDIELRSDLKGFEHKAWKDAKNRCLASWRKLFHPWEPKRGSDVHALVSGATNAKYFR